MLSPETKYIQNQLGRYCQTGVLPQIPGINRKHIKHYRRLVFNIVRNNLLQAYPIAAKVIGKERFVGMIEQFFGMHDAKSPQLWKLPKEFYDFAVACEWSKEKGYSWLEDLLLFEWMEIQVHTMPDRQKSPAKSKGNLLQDKLVVNKEFEIIQLTHPVHLMPAKQTPERKGNYYVLLFRHSANGTVHFLNLSELHVTLIERLARTPASIAELAEIAYIKYSLPRKEELESAFSNFFSDMRDQGLILGTL